MNIFGIGCDLTIPKRFYRLSVKNLSRILSANEQQQYQQINTNSHKLIFLARIWASKEAILKATKQNNLFFMSQIDIPNQHHQLDFFIFKNYKIYLTITHSDGQILAFCIAYNIL